MPLYPQGPAGTYSTEVLPETFCQDVEQPFKRANKRISCREGKMGVVGEMISRACSLQFTAAPVFVLEILSPCIVLSDKLFLG